ncbi:MAG: HNH endonuclease [Ruminococcaceae bacterium]|nr:HNH endonuclease [Oscillospiraceae bacterium]
MSNDTKYADVKSALGAVGKTVFVDFYYDFKNANMSFEELRDKLYAENPNSRSKQQRFRIPRARHIFQLGQEIEALNIIIESKRLPSHVINKAKHILAEELLHNELESDRYDENSFMKEVEREVVYSDIKDFVYDNTPHPPKKATHSLIKQYHRSKIVSRNALIKAGCLCEVDNTHPVFKRKNSNMNYTEPHHIIPVYAFADFPDVDLDREQNVVSLCSHCHNLLHYGSEIDYVLKPLYEQRKELLKLIGLEITYEDLKKYYK